MDGRKGGWGLLLIVCACNIATSAVDLHNTVDAAGAMEHLVKGWTNSKNIVFAAPESGCVSYQQGNDCVIFSLGRRARLQFAAVHCLPPSFISVQHAQTVRRNMN